MKSKLVLTVIVLTVSGQPGFGQTTYDIARKYADPVQAYSVSEHIWMTPECARDGQVCRMRLYPKRIDGDTNYLTQKLPLPELRDVLNKLVPIDQRGAKQVGFGNAATGGPAAWTTFAYEKVTFTFVAALPSLGYDDSPPIKKGELVFSPEMVKDAERPASASPSNDDFQHGETSNSDIVTVTWNVRKCPQQ
jgi:hypothetical protein